jgi:NADH-quinone oxidoreductase subunit G
MNKEFMIIDNIPVAINGEKNLLELIRKAGIELPTFCYYSELSVYGACRMCMVENKWGGMEIITQQGAASRMRCMRGDTG